MPDESQHKESENHARIRTERFFMRTFGATRSDARKALRQDAAERRAAQLTPKFPAADAIQQQVQISETAHEVKKSGTDAPSIPLDSTPPSNGTPPGTIEVFLTNYRGVMKNVEFYIGEVTDP